MIHDYDPDTIRIPDTHDRDLAAADLSDLIASIRDLGQQVPVILRDCDGPELVCGARRVAACRAVGVEVRGQMRDLDDEAAFVLRDAENRHRADLYDLDRARSYAAAVEAHYGGDRKAMAARIGVSLPHLTRLLTLARMPDAVVAAYPSRAALRERHARALAPWLDDPRLIEAAQGIAPGLSAAKVTAALAAAMGGGPAAKEEARTFRFRHGVRGVTVRRVGRKMRIEYDADLSGLHLKGALDAFLARKD
ncbi:Chromosome-partitioning protein ParB [Jannaschia seosinensis]|uniref:Chromosome-partitioning protein ParB n=1 Tax=Jannaschia seosinensis TaxID=313367 RepID=A0A0M7B645_9RHOB|nr:ParB/RepB/Spo0J family partition protein [Jannaschia seosinensis]CUH16587.1 Chromosome-partitioning protein ParB [Jannaschia seosinensis]